MNKKLEFLKKRMFFHEARLLRIVDFDTSRVLAIDFLNYFAEDAGFNSPSKRYFYCLYLLNVSYLSPKLRSLSQSLLAFAIVYFVNRIFAGDEDWPVTRMDSSTHNLLGLRTKKLASLRLNDRFAEWFKCVDAFQGQFRTALDEITRVGDTSTQEMRSRQEYRFLSKMSNSVKEDTGPNVGSDASCAEKENMGPPQSVENSHRNTCKSKTQSIFTQKNLNKHVKEDKSTGVSRVQPAHVPSKTISSFRVLTKGGATGREMEPSEARTKTRFREIEFDFAKVKSVAMDVFNGKSGDGLTKVYNEYIQNKLTVPRENEPPRITSKFSSQSRFKGVARMRVRKMR